MNNQKVLATFLVAVLAASAFSVVGLSAVPLQKASAQTVTIETSADALGETFFGEAMLQVIVEDSSADDENADTLTVTVDLSSSEGDTSQSITVPDTTPGSQRFEFFIVHTGAADKTPADPETNAALTDDQILEFGDAAGADELEVTGLALYDDASFDIIRGNQEVTIDYEEASAELVLDRNTYGSDSIMYLTIVDQDANLDPTESGLITITDNPGLVELFDITGAAFDGDVTIDETGDNTARFEATLQLTDAATAATDELVFTSDAVQITLNDMANYADFASNYTGAENDSTDTSSRSFDVEDEDGEFDDIGTVTFASELKLTLNDNDRNRDSDDDESLTGAVKVQVEGGDVNGDDILDAGEADQEVLDMEETDDNTGIFIIDLSNNELPITFLADGESPTFNNSLLELRAGEITDDIIVTYTDTRDDNSITSETSSQTVEMTLAAGSIDLPDAAGINDDFLVTITDADLNNNPRTRDSYTFTLDAASPFELERGGDSIGDLANLEVEIEGDAVDFSPAITETLVETDVNSGVFTVELDMQEILDSTGVDTDDGDNLEITYNDNMDDTSRESSDDLAIGEETTGVDFSRTTLPIPPEVGSAVEDKVGGTVFVTLIVTDPDSNVASGAEDILGFDIGTDPGEFFFEIEGDGFSDQIDGTAGNGISDTIDGASFSLDDILDFASLSLSETGQATGVFDDTMEFTDDASIDSDEWHDMEITVTFVDADGDEESAGVTFRGNDGSVTVDQSSAKAGTVLEIIVEDQDLNLDDDEVEEFPASTDEDLPADDQLLIVETEDEELTGETSETFRETGPDTGIFTATYVVGTDIPISELPGGDDEIEQATNILITYNDETDSSGGGGDEIEVNVPVVSSTGAITVTPELVGPGTELQVIITDSDLDQDSKSTDNYDTPDPDEDDFFVSFRSDRTEVGRASPDIEETGPNTGVFTFDIELVTDETDCEDDDLGDAKYEATGGSQPEIGACPGDLISIRYDDEQDGSGRSTTVSAVVEIRSWDPEFSSDKPSYNVGDRMTITIADPDANRKPDVADSLTDIRVFSDSDRVGEELSALETGRDTGVFRLVFGTSSTSTGGAITVRTGDDVTIEYTDAFPADFEEEEDDKDFTFVVPVGAAGANTGATTPSAPEVKDVSGGSVDDIVPGQQVVLTTTVQNNLEEDLPFVALIEVRDSSGITVFLAWQTGTLNADGRAEVGLSWTPDRSGDYQVRTFVVSNLNNPQVLSQVMTSNITVS